MFTANAWLALLTIILIIAGRVFGFAAELSPARLVLSFLILIAWAGINWWTARQLLQGRRRALVAGVPLFVLGVAQALISSPRDRLVIGLQVLCLLALLSVWNELDTW
jgi:hypothetical protein